MLLVGIGYLIGGSVIAAGSSFFIAFGGGLGVACGVIVLILGVLAILGGIFAIQRKSFALALIGAIFTIPSILGLIGLILIAVSRDEFNS